MNAKPPNRSGLRAMRYIALISQLPFLIVAGYGIGYALDDWLGTGYWRVICLLAGILAGFSQLIRELLKDTRPK